MTNMPTDLARLRDEAVETCTRLLGLTQEALSPEIRTEVLTRIGAVWDKCFEALKEVEEKCE
jgi:hypothetical protein